jgi:GMP synthase-like glutamine amidotransferase
MKPVAIFRAAPTEGPGYFASYLERRSIPWRLVKLVEGAAVPRDARRFAGLAFMGGPMSVNDELPWIIPALELIRDAARKDVPVIGHCLGGQLLSKAFGGAVADNAVARAWLDGVQAFSSFHWHGETFSIPPGATRILEGAHCANQAFALGKHLGMQCHVEMTQELVRAWLETGAKEIEESRKSPAVQRPQDIARDLATRVGELNEIATRLYERWTAGLSS